MIGNFSVTHDCGVLMNIIYPGLDNLRDAWHAHLNYINVNYPWVIVPQGSGNSGVNQYAFGTMALMPSAACTAATIKGRYIFASTYLYPAGVSERKDSVASSSYIGEEYYDGVSKVYGVQTLGSVPSASPLLRQTFNGSYAVNADCTVTESFGYFQIIMADLSQWYLSTNIANGFYFGWSPRGLP